MITSVIAIIAGIIQLTLGLFKFGFVMRFVPHPALKGFASAAAIIIASTQIPQLLGFSSASHEFVYQTLASMVRSMLHSHPLTLVVGVCSLGFILGIKRYAPRLPSSLIVMTLAIITSYLFDLNQHGVKTVGTIVSSLPSFQIPNVSLATIATLLTKASVIAFVGFLEAYAIARTFAQKGKKVNVNQELIGQGLANTVTGLYGGFTVSGSFSRTAVTYNAGAKTAFTGVYVSIIVMMVLLFFSPLLALLPKTVLAAVVIAAVIQLIDIKSLIQMFTISKQDGIIAFTTFFLSFALKPDDAIMIGIVVGLVMFLNRVMTANLVEVGFDPGTKTLKAIRNGAHVQTFQHALTVRIDMSLMYMNCERIFEQLQALLVKRMNEKKSLKAIILDCSGINYIDVTALESLESFTTQLQTMNIQLFCFNAKYQARETLRTVAHHHPIRIFQSLEEIQKLFPPQRQHAKVK